MNYGLVSGRGDGDSRRVRVCVFAFRFPVFGSMLASRVHAGTRGRTRKRTHTLNPRTRTRVWMSFVCEPLSNFALISGTGGVFAVTSDRYVREPFSGTFNIYVLRIWNV